MDDVQHRGEGDLQRADRNWDELLGELRVTQNGVAILFSLLLTVPVLRAMGTYGLLPAAATRQHRHRHGGGRRANR
jgi:hypothetical protein